MWQMLLFLTQMDFFWEIPVFPQVTEIGLFGTKTAYLHLEIQSCRKYCFQKLSQFSQWSNVLYAHASVTNGFLLRYKCFYNSAERAYFEHSERISTLKNISCKKHSFLILNSHRSNYARCSCF
jgi:hypothetical protein